MISFLFNFNCVYIGFAYIDVCVRVSVPLALEVTDSCEPSLEFWELNLGPLKE